MTNSIPSTNTIFVTPTVMSEAIQTVEAEAIRRTRARRSSVTVLLAPVKRMDVPTAISPSIISPRYCSQLVSMIRTCCAECERTWKRTGSTLLATESLSGLTKQKLRKSRRMAHGLKRTSTPLSTPTLILSGVTCSSILRHHLEMFERVWASSLFVSLRLQFFSIDYGRFGIGLGVQKGPQCLKRIWQHCSNETTKPQ